MDPQRLEEPNFVRGLLARRSRTEANAAKVDEVVTALAHHSRLAVRPHKMTIADFVAARPRYQPLPLLLTPVDSVASRREIQDCLPLEVINAACDGAESSISGHVTDDGPCVYCLHLPEVLDAERIRERLIATSMRLPAAMVRGLLASMGALTDEQIRYIESLNGLTPGTLVHQAGLTLDALYRANFLYGEMGAKSAAGGRVAVASPFLTALTGFLLGAELLKASGAPEFSPYRLGTRGRIATKYSESLLNGPLSALLSNVRRWGGAECLCRSARRLRLLRQRYGIKRSAAASHGISGRT